ncbi:MAG: DMT family transporter, partial [Alphaproteobacteria bacterium]|nr:DMT family transporter [Alphaproteobacteria bacterium]
MTGALLMTAAASMMAGAGLLIQLASRHTSDSTIIFVAFAVGGAIALPLAMWHGLIFTEQTHVGLQILRVLSGVSQIALFFMALRTLPLVDSVLLRAAAPIWVPILLQLFWKQRMPGKTWLFIGAGFIGLVLVLQPFWTPLTIGYVFAIASGLLFAFQNIFLRQLDQLGEPPLRTLAFVFVGGALLSAVPAASAWETPPVGTLLMLLVIGVVMVSAS